MSSCGKNNGSEVELLSKRDDETRWGSLEEGGVSNLHSRLQSSARLNESI